MYTTDEQLSKQMGERESATARLGTKYIQIKGRPISALPRSLLPDRIQCDKKSRQSGIKSLEALTASLVQSTGLAGAITGLMKGISWNGKSLKGVLVFDIYSPSSYFLI